MPNYRSADGNVLHNSLGYRGAEFLLRRNPGITRIVCLGDSGTYCVGLRDNETWPVRLSARLCQYFDNEVINAGVPAYVSSELLLSYIFKIEELQPDWLVIYPTITDAAARRVGVLSRDYREFCRGWYEPIRLKSIADLKKYSRFGGTVAYRVRRLLHGSFNREKVYEGSSDVFAANLRDLVVLAKAHGVGIILVCPGIRGENVATACNQNDDSHAVAMAENREAMKAIGREFSLPVLDMGALLPQPPVRGERSEFYSDSVHLTPLGADEFARHVADALLQHAMRPQIHSLTNSQ